MSVNAQAEAAEYSHHKEEVKKLINSHENLLRSTLEKYSRDNRLDGELWRDDVRDMLNER